MMFTQVLAKHIRGNGLRPRSCDQKEKLCASPLTVATAGWMFDHAVVCLMCEIDQPRFCRERVAEGCKLCSAACYEIWFAVCAFL